MSARTRALEKKAVNEDAKAAKAAADKEREDEAQWAVGAKKGKDDEDKEALKRQKAAEKAALLAQEEAELSGITRVAKPTKKKGKDDLDFLKQALAQQPKTKAQKEAEQKAKADEERKRKEQEARAAKEERRKVCFNALFSCFISILAFLLTLFSMCLS